MKTEKSLLTFLLVGTLAGSSLAKNVEPAPDDWIVYNDQVWLPVVDPLHASMATAFNDFKAHQYDKAADHLKQGAAFLDKEAAHLPKTRAAKARGAAAELQDLARLAEKSKLTKKEFIDGTERAYLSDAENRWIVFSETVTEPVLDKPGVHMAQGLKDAKAGKPKLAAADFRRAAGYVDLIKGQGDDSRRLQDLANLADENALPKIPAIEKELAYVSRDLAHYELKMADQETNAERSSAHLRAAAYHIDKSASYEHRTNDDLQRAVAHGRSATAKTPVAEFKQIGKELEHAVTSL